MVKHTKFKPPPTVDAPYVFDELYPKELPTTDDIKHKDKLQGIQFCNCRGKKHRVAVVNGSVILLDHNLFNETAVLECGGRMFRCMTVMECLQKGKPLALHHSWQPYITEMQIKKTRRARNRPIVREYAPGPTLKRIRLLLRYKCDYELITEDTLIFIDYLERKPHVTIKWHYLDGTLEGPTQLQINLYLQEEWLEKVYNRGIAVVEKRLVLAYGGIDVFGNEKGTLVRLLVYAKHPQFGNMQFGTQDVLIIKHNEKEWRILKTIGKVYF